MIKTAVIGYGFSAKTFHLPFIETSAQLELVSLSTSNVEQVRAKYPNVSAYTTAQELINDSDVQLVIITAPNDAHFF